MLCDVTTFNMVDQLPPSRECISFSIWDITVSGFPHWPLLNLFCWFLFIFLTAQQSSASRAQALEHLLTLTLRVISSSHGSKCCLYSDDFQRYHCCLNVPLNSSVKYSTAFSTSPLGFLIRISNNISRISWFPPKICSSKTLPYFSIGNYD